MLDSAPLRFLASLCVALCVVSVLLWFGLEISGFTARQERRALETHAVDLLSDAERRGLRDLLGEGRPGPLPEPSAIAPIDRPRELRGMVRLEVDVDAAGGVSGIRVIDASPAGIYESQAIVDVRRRKYAPEIQNGRAVPSRRLEIVDFVVTPAALAAVESE